MNDAPVIQESKWPVVEMVVTAAIALLLGKAIMIHMRRNDRR